MSGDHFEIRRMKEVRRVVEGVEPRVKHQQGRQRPALDAGFFLTFADRSRFQSSTCIYVSAVRFQLSIDCFSWSLRHASFITKACRLVTRWISRNACLHSASGRLWTVLMQVTRSNDLSGYGSAVALPTLIK